jgi:hypothetical protein
LRQLQKIGNRDLGPAFAKATAWHARDLGLGREKTDEPVNGNLGRLGKIGKGEFLKWTKKWH